MYETIKELQKRNYDINGLSAGYVTQTILLDEYEEGWTFMLSNYDKNLRLGIRYL
ncbi:MAG: hypothetical protein AAGF26_01515 [Cyanobacteria bacterium P01_G01_bin.49]